MDTANYFFDNYFYFVIGENVRTNPPAPYRARGTGGFST